jgi:hypothetical protein
MRDGTAIYQVQNALLQRMKEKLAKGYLGSQVLMGKQGRMVLAGSGDQLENQDLWDLLERMDRMELLDPLEFRDLRASLVRMEIMVVAAP